MFPSSPVLVYVICNIRSYSSGVFTFVLINARVRSTTGGYVSTGVSVHGGGGGTPASDPRSLPKGVPLVLSQVLPGEG